MALVSLTDLRSVFVFSAVFTFRFSSINKEISLSSTSLLVSRNSFSLKTSKFGKHSLFLRKKRAFRPFFHRSPCKPNA